MKILISLISLVITIVVIILFSCEKTERYNWKCDSIVMIYPPGQKCPETIVTPIYHDNMSDSELGSYIEEKSYTLRSVNNGDITLVIFTISNCERKTK